jgi:hypothetical protein
MRVWTFVINKQQVTRSRCTSEHDDQTTLAFKLSARWIRMQMTRVKNEVRDRIRDDALLPRLSVSLLLSRVAQRTKQHPIRSSELYLFSTDCRCHVIQSKCMGHGILGLPSQLQRRRVAKPARGNTKILNRTVARPGHGHGLTLTQAIVGVVAVGPAWPGQGHCQLGLASTAAQINLTTRACHPSFAAASRGSPLPHPIPQ